MKHLMQGTLIVYLQSEQRPLHREKLVDELMRMAKSSPGSYPQASKAKWMETLDQLVADGLVSAAGERVAIIRRKLADRDESGFLF